MANLPPGSGNGAARLNTAPPVPKANAASMATFTAQSAHMTNRCGKPGSGSFAPVSLPIEKTSDPATGWASRDATRQLSTYVPATRPFGSGTPRVSPFSAISVRSVCVPSGAISLITNADTGSLNLRLTRPGESDSNEFWAGAVSKSCACDHAGDAESRDTDNISSRARIDERMRAAA